MSAVGSGFGRTHHHYKELKRQFRKDCATRDWGGGCVPTPSTTPWCGPTRSPSAWTTPSPRRHIPSWGNDVLDFRPAHLVCNQMRGDDEPHIDIGTPSEEW
ncbi:uncharacterized protein RMCC_2409 [Mycolicibacterium canariasense]|uniref:Uncharacterized protein n=1 Tax=Mycolicibacterium canariasense TaxID=228230 RepID=A0A100WCG1_MYCCR|nr:uncharacterized protein RMCC_2409 [Mycolicibacterium canariasense]